MRIPARSIVPTTPFLTRLLAAACVACASLAPLTASALTQSFVSLTATPRYAAPDQPIALQAAVYFENLIFIFGPWLNPFPGTATFFDRGVPIAGCTALAFPNDESPQNVSCPYLPASPGDYEFHVEYSGGGDYTPGASASVPVTVAPAVPVDTPIAFAVNYVGSTFGAIVASQPVALTGFTGARPITVSGGQYAVGCLPPWRTDPSTVAPNDVLCVRHVTPSAANAFTRTTVTIGTVASTFESYADDPASSPFGQDATIAAAISHSLADTYGAGLVGWGDNTGGKLGNGSTSATAIPRSVFNTNGPIVAGGLEHSLILSSDGRVFSAGLDSDGQLGTTTYTRCVVPDVPADFACNPSPVQVGAFDDVVAIGAGWRHSLALRRDGTVWAWGSGQFYGQTGTAAPMSPPAKVAGIPGTVVRIAAGYMHSVALLEDGRVFAWGSNQFGELGPGAPVDMGQHPVPLEVTGLTDVVDIAAGGSYTLALKADGTVWSWGVNVYGQLGDPAVATRIPSINAPAFRATPAAIPTLGSVRQIAAGFSFAFARRNDGTVVGWGLNHRGQVNGTPQSAPTNCGSVGSQSCIITPTTVPYSNVVAMYAGGAHALLLDSLGRIRAIGDNSTGQCAAPIPVPAPIPAPVTKFEQRTYDPDTFLNPAGVGGTPAGVGFSSGAGGIDLNDTSGGVDFGSQPTGVTSDPITLRFSNLSGAELTINGVSLTEPGEFAAASRCTPKLAKDASCEIDLSFTPAELSDRSAFVNIGFSTATEALSIQLQLRGTGVDPRAVPVVSLVAPGGLSTVAGSPATFEATVTAAAAEFCPVVPPASTPAPGTCTIDFELLSGGPSTAGTLAGCGAIPLSSGKASCATSALAVGVHSIRANFTGSSALQPSSSFPALTFTVTSPGVAQSITFTQPPDRTFGDAPFVLSPLSSAGLPVVLSSATPAVCTVSGTTATLAGAGTCTLNANQPGDASTLPAPQVSRSFTVAKAVQAITFGALGNKVLGSAPFTVSATGGASGNAVAFASATPAACTISASTVTLVAAGTCTITASQAGNASYADAIPVSQSFSVGQSVVTLTVTLSGAGGGSVTSNPAGINCGTSCAAGFVAGTPVTLTPMPASDSVFDGWGGACTGKASCTVPMTAATAVTATFIKMTAIPRLGNISTRMQVLTGNNVMIGGFIIGGTLAKTVVVRARGPSLADFGITNPLANPMLQLFAGPTQIAFNDNWKEAANQATLAASGFAPSNDFESAIYVTLEPGAYTAIVSGAGGATGVGIVEVFEVDLPQVPLLNISTRGSVLTGNDVMIGGFIIMGDQPQTVVVRARGPSLTAAGVPGALQDPVLQLLSGQAEIASNDNWQTANNAALIESSGFAPGDPRESAIRITLQPGAYTAIVRGAGSTTGVGIIEVFAQ